MCLKPLRIKKKAEFSKDNTKDQTFYTFLNSWKESNDIWYLDNGCSKHMTGSRHWFVSLDEKVPSQVKLGDGKL